MGKYLRWITTSCAAGAIALAAPGAAVAGNYPVPKVSGGTTTKGSAKAAGKAIQHTSVSTLASKGLKLKVHFPAAGTITVTVSGPGTSGKGSVTATKAGTKTVKVTFTKVGNAGTKVTVTVLFKPSGKKGKASTSKTTVTLG